MLRRLQSQKPKLNEAARQAIYRALQERETLVQPQRIEHNTARSQQWAAFYRGTWSDSASQAESQWRAAFEELNASRTHSDPEFLIPSTPTFDLAESLIRWIKAIGSMPVPEITLDGEGNLYLEWRSHGKRLTLCLSDNPAGSYIYLGVGREYNAYSMNLNDLQRTVYSYLT